MGIISGSSRSTTQNFNEFDIDNSVDNTVDNRVDNSLRDTSGSGSTQVGGGGNKTRVTNTNFNNINTTNNVIDGGAFDVANSALALAGETALSNEQLTRDAIAANENVSELAILSGVESLDLTANAVSRANDNVVDIASQSIDFASGAHDTIIGATERLGESFINNTSRVFDTSVGAISNMASENTDLAYDLSNSFMNGASDNFSDSLNAITRNSMYVNDSILAMARDSNGEVSEAYSRANDRFADAMETQNQNSISMMAGLFAETSNQLERSANNQFNSAIDMISANNQDAYKMVQESAKTEGERTTDTLIKFAMGAVAVVGVAFALKGGK